MRKLEDHKDYTVCEICGMGGLNLDICELSNCEFPPAMYFICEDCWNRYRNTENKSKVPTFMDRLRKQREFPVSASCDPECEYPLKTLKFQIDNMISITRSTYPNREVLKIIFIPIKSAKVVKIDFKIGEK